MQLESKWGIEESALSWNYTRGPKTGKNEGEKGAKHYVGWKNRKTHCVCGLVWGVQKSSVEGLLGKEINAKELPHQAFLKLGHATCLVSKLHLLNVKHAIQ